MLEQHGFAASRGTYDARNHRLRNLEIDAVKNDLTAEPLTQIVHDDRVVVRTCRAIGPVVPFRFHRRAGTLTSRFKNPNIRPLRQSLLKSVKAISRLENNPTRG